MAKKIDRICDLAIETTLSLSDYRNWTAFLKTAAWMYKYPFEDQVLIYAQRPDAKACADFDTWHSESIRRSINRGATGIALLRENAAGYYLDHVFDVTDTNRFRNGIDIKLWKYEGKYTDEIIETLENTFGELLVSVTLNDAIICAAHNAVADNKTDYLSELSEMKTGSFLEELDEQNIAVRFAQLAELSVAYIVMVRMGIDPSDMFDETDFSDISDFNTPETISVLGNIVSEISEQALREISGTIRAERKKEYEQAKKFAQKNTSRYNIDKDIQNTITQTERTDDDDRDNIQKRERDTDTELGSTEEQPPDRQIRDDAEEIPQAEQPQPLLGDDDSRDIDGTPARDRQDSKRAGRADDFADGESRGREREVESGEPAEVDRSYEQPQTFRRRGSAETVSSQLTLFDLDYNPDIQGDMQREAERLNNIRPAFSIPQQVIDTVLCDGTHLKESVITIVSEFSKDKSLGDKVAFLKDHYKTDGKGFMLDEKRISAWWNEDGIRISYGNTVETGNKQMLSWEDVARRIDELLDMGRFAPTDILLQVDDYIYTQTAERFWDMKRELNYGEFPVLKEWLAAEVYDSEGGYQEDVNRIKEYLKTPAGLDDIKTVTQRICDLYDQNKDVVRFEFANPHNVNKMLEDLYIVRKQYTAQELSYVPPVRFITEDEISKLLLRGTGVHEGKYRTYIFFTMHPDKQERMTFLKHEYGISGSYDGYRNESHDGKGIAFSHGNLMQPYAQTLLKWNEVEKRIDKLIKRGVYLNPKEIENIPNYEREQVATAVHNAFLNVMDESRYKPYPKDLHFVDTSARKYIIERFDNPEQLTEMMTELRNLVMETPKDDRYYKSRAEALETLEQYANGTFNLFPSIERPVPAKVIEEPVGENSIAHVPDETSELVGRELELDGRKFIVDSINREFGTASLKDITFENGTGFPIFRRESVEFVKAALESKEKANEVITPAFEMPKPSKVANTVVYPEIPMSERRNFAIDNDELGYGGPKEKFRKNMEAIRVLKECEQERRLATPEEQTILSEYVGWGGLPDAFDETKSNWADEFRQLTAALSPEEYEQARASTLTSHYTSPAIIKSMYKALENMGFSQGNIFEPACGIGNFMGLVPESMKDSKIYGIELDSITGRIAQQLYQRNSVAIQGFEDTTIPDSFFDVAIGNVPFGDYKLSDKKYNKHNFLIYDYLFAKTLDKVRSGGIVAFITSSGTMDKRNSKVRQYIAQRADLVGAIRLPNNAFLKNAGTEVTADILFLQKRDRMTDIMPDWVHLGTLENGIAVNQYFVDNPDMILGEMQMVSGPFGPTPTCMPYEDVPLSEQLNEAIQNIHATITEYEIDDVSNDEEMTIPADPEVRNFSFTLVDGDVYFRENSLMRKVELNATAQNRIKGMIAIRDCVRTLIEYQTEGYPDWEIQKQQEKLNTIYDDFTKKYGLINSRGNGVAFSDDSSYFLLCSLEVLDENGELERKADMFTKRTIGAKLEITKVDTSSEALAVSLGEKAKIDMEFMSSLTGKTEEEIYEDLQGVIFLNPHYNEDDEPAYLTADEYLSGNVREKLSVVKDLAVHDEAFKINVEALTAVQPKDLSASEITVRLGSTWIPQEDIQEFVYELLSPGWYARDKIEVKYSNLTGEWSISNKSYDKGVKATNTFGTKRISAYKIIEESLNLKDVRIFDYVEDEEGRKKPVLNKKETMIAGQKQDIIKAEFDNWIWKNPDRRERLTRLYNERFNSNRPREYDGSHITFNGMNPEIVLRKHQEDAVARIMYGGNSLLGHVVGAGKSWTMVAAAMESKRLGLCNKSLFVVPNHLTEQWASEFLQLYPAANILVATKKDFETKNRKKFCGRIATGDYDAVIIGHSQFEKIPMSFERQVAILERQKDEIMRGIIEAKSQKAERFTIKQLEKSKKAIENKLAKLNDQSRKDDVVTFEELGVDRIFVDEAHYYKNLYLYTKMRNVGGIAQTEAQKSSDLFMKTQYLDELTGGKGVIFATGTPVSNSMVELYTMQRYLQYNTLREHNLQHFDAWASTFGETITAIELAPEGTGYRAKTRFAKFFNLPELMAMFKDVADIQTADMLNLPTPTPHYKTIAVEPTEIQKEMVKELAERAERVRNKMVDPSVDNMLKITNDGRKLALDQRLMNPLLPDDESSKVSACAKEVFDIWQETSDIRGTQLVFCDLSTPKSDGSFNVYSDIRDKLIANGVPESEIEFIHNAETEVKKKELFSKVRKGDVRILLGSTPKMGAGTNVQRLLVALHDLDCPWRPADLEQRAGRIIRQGNTNSDVHIRRYVTKDTFDSYMWQLVENKQKFIGQIMTSKSPVRSAEDIDEMALSYAEIKALTTGNPYIKEKMDLDTQVAKLKLIKSSFMSQKYELEDKVIKEYPRTIADLTERIRGFEGDIAIVEKYPKQEDTFYPMTIDGLPYTDKEKAGTALLERCKKMTSPEPTPIGDWRGFSMDLSFDTTTKVFYVSLKGHLSHKVELGTDVFGNLQRLDNALEGLPKRLEIVKGNLEETKKQFETAKVESQKEFPQEAELQEKIKRLAEVEVLLDMDKKDKEGADLGEPEENEIPQKKVVGLER